MLACGAVVFAGLAFGQSAWGLDPGLDVSQYAHTAWKIRDGFTTGSILAMAQTPDGYLWLGTEFGLYRFDGVRNVPWTPPGGEQLPSNNIVGLLAARDGTLWIGTYKGLASWKDGKLTRYPGIGELDIFPMLEDRDGTVWAGVLSLPPPGKLCAIRAGNIQCYGEDGSLGYGVLRVFEDSKGNLWVGTGTGLWRWKPGPPKFYSLPGDLSGIRALAEDVDGALLVGWKGGIWRFIDGKTEAYPLPRGLQPFIAMKLLRDRDGGLWIGTHEKGLVHVHQGKTDVFAQPDGLSSSSMNTLFEDREGNVWTSTYDGLDRFREFAVATYGAKQGLPMTFVSSVLAGGEGSIWLGGLGALYRWKNGEFGAYNKGDGKLNGVGPMSLFLDARGKVWVSTSRGVGYIENDRFIPSGISEQKIYSFAEDKDGNLWMANAEEVGLIRLSAQNEIRKIPWAELGNKDYGRVLAIDPSKGGLWIGFEKGGVSYFADGRVRETYSAADGLGSGTVNRLRFGPRGTLWPATDGGLSRIRDGRVMTLTSKNGLPCDTVHWSAEDDYHFLWVNMTCGLVRIAKSDLDAWVAAMERDKNAKPTIQVTVFDISDGVRGRSYWGHQPQVTKTADGKLWFTGYDGVAVVDPRHLPFNKVPPPVQIEQVTADRKTYNVVLQGGRGAEGVAQALLPVLPDAQATAQERRAQARVPVLRLPPLIRDLQIDYTALSLVAPEKVQFKYKLEGWDRDWQDAGTRRQAFYTNLPPKNYTFRVMACNNSGVWNEAGTFLDFSVAPAYYQTIWFRLLCVAAFLALLWAFYQMRLRRVAQQFNMRLEERVSERTRIARELHDTLLQNFQGVLLKFQATTYLLPGRPEEARKILETTVDQAAHAITEGRDAVQGLRSSTKVTNDLACEITTLGQELASGETNTNAAGFHVEVEGASRDLHPILRDEVYRIAAEALRNAFKHAQAQRIEVEIHYDERQLRLRVRDDGKGIDAKHLKEEGRAGHFGLRGMRERAKLMGGRLAVWSEMDSGTEVELKIPASRAYETAPGRRRSWLAEKLSGKLAEKDTQAKS